MRTNRSATRDPNTHARVYPYRRTKSPRWGPYLGLRDQSGYVFYETFVFHPIFPNVHVIRTLRSFEPGTRSNALTFEPDALTFEPNLFHVKQRFCVSRIRFFFMSKLFCVRSSIVDRRHFAQLSACRHRAFERRSHLRPKRAHHSNASATPLRRVTRGLT